jgi:predicted house-cleaning noncanonical NTP pyrophosphatase (MazG superfamily)
MICSIYDVLVTACSSEDFKYKLMNKLLEEIAIAHVP